MYIEAKSVRAQSKSTNSKKLTNMAGTKALPVHNAPKADAYLAQKNKTPKRGVGKKSMESAPAAHGFEVKRKASLGYTRMPVACGKFVILSTSGPCPT